MNNKIIIIILLSVLIFATYSNNIETFAANSINIEGIIESLDEILECEKNEYCKGKIQNVVQMRKKLGYPNFDIFMYNDLIKMRRKFQRSLTIDEVREYLYSKSESELYNSFNNVREGFEDVSECIRMYQEFATVMKRSHDTYEEELRNYRERREAAQVDLEIWKAEYNAMKPEWDKGWYIVPNSGQIEWEKSPKTCEGGYGGCCGDHASEWQRKCLCQGYSTACNTCFGKIRYHNDNNTYCTNQGHYINNRLNQNRLGNDMDMWIRSRLLRLQPEFTESPPIFEGPDVTLICQDCRQYVGNYNVEDSLGVALNQYNKCIVDLGLWGESPTPTPKPTPTTPSTTPTPSPDEDDKTLLFALLGGGTGLISIISIVLVVILAVVLLL
jgi:hypothetical protein